MPRGGALLLETNGVMVSLARKGLLISMEAYVMSAPSPKLELSFKFVVEGADAVAFQWPVLLFLAFVVYLMLRGRAFKAIRKLAAWLASL